MACDPKGIIEIWKEKSIKMLEDHDSPLESFLVLFSHNSLCMIKIKQKKFM